jgi:hypothetical protein
MSQNLFAAWIGLESSLLAKWETNKRSLGHFPEAKSKSYELEVQWQTFSQNWMPDPSFVLELPADEIKKRKKRVEGLLWDEDNLAKKRALWKEPEVDFPKARAFLKSVQPIETESGAAYAILGHLDVLDKREFQSLKSRQNLEIALLKVQAELTYLKTQPDWLPFFPPETNQGS